MGLSPAVFDDMKPAEFIYAWIGWQELQRINMQQEWERERWATYCLMSVQIERKHHKPMTEMLPLPWDAPSKKNASRKDLTLAERRERIKQHRKLLKG